MFDLKGYLASKQENINSYLDKILQESDISCRIVTAMRYSLLAGGKRIRPVLCMAAVNSVGGVGENFLTEACAIEMIHTYSLIHDDLPAMDNDDLRRGRQTCHKAFDEATAILAGDALLTLAFQILSSKSFLSNNKQNEKNLNKSLQVINIIASASGYKGMIEGQMRDIASEGTNLDIDELKNLHYMKTGALIDASIIAGATMGGGNTEEIEKLHNYSKNVGLAFQVADDILNVEGDPVIMGKAAGTDEIRKKATYPSLIGIEKSKKLAMDLVNKGLIAIESFDKRSDPLRAIANYIIERKK
jgi:geranylgeranyl diphosphate synthase type II